MEKWQDEINKGVQTAFIDMSINSNLALRPKFISNNYLKGNKVLCSIEDELRSCDEFMFSVAFITESGITPLLQIFKELEDRGIRGKIITTNYLSFSEPKALAKLAGLSNLDIKMYRVEGKDAGFHTKGYIFRHDDNYKIIVGSSNLTLNALTKNREWNIQVISTEKGEIANHILEEFKELWDVADPLNDWIDTYTKIYEEQRRIAREAAKQQIVSLQQYILKPNNMQISFVENLIKIREQGENKALLISATGTGKTYASAFALRDANPKKALFIVHRKQIAKQALNSYKNVFGNNKTFGLLTGNSKDTDADFIFATMQTISKEEMLHSFRPDEFSMIVIDEAHHSAANSYKRIMNYFNPKFWLGMTASPDRRTVKNMEPSIYEIFDHNIAYEIRLQKAMEENLLCPFHYFGITDLELDGETISDETGLRNFSLLTSDARVEYILERANYYGYSGDRVKGLIFCSRVNEANALSEKFQKYGLRTAVLTGNDSDEVREEVIEKLVGSENKNCLDYILSVDVFSEGVDIPEINQVIMLRPTESPIVFIQQLGRGLRKSEGKEYVVILDFIGNYTNNFMIPIALSGDRTYNKDNIRKYVMEGTRIIPGSSSIHFDEIAKSRIFASIDKVSTTKKMLYEKYLLLKDKLGQIPNILDFYEHSEVDPLLFIEYSGTYHHFLQLIESEYKVRFSEKEENTLEFVSSLLANGKRPHELLILKRLLAYEDISFEGMKENLSDGYDVMLEEADYESAIHFLEGKFMNTQGEKKKFAEVEFLSQQAAGFYKRTISFYKRIENREFYKALEDVILLGLQRFQDIYITSRDGLVLYQKYSRKDVCRVLNWEQDYSSTIYGYKIKYNSCPIFVTYHKDEGISESTKYNDHFINQRIFNWMTRSTGNWREEAAQIMNYQKNGMKSYLFIKKSDGEGTDFYFMGQAIPIEAIETKNTNGAPIMNIKFELEQAVREDIFDYIAR